MTQVHPLLEDLIARGLIFQSTDLQSLGEALSTGAPFYVGFDPTASDLHLGNYAMILLMRRLQKAGASPLVLVGGATGMIGDPSGKNSERQLLDHETVIKNKTAIKALFSRFLKGFEMVDNFDWFSSFSMIDFLRDVGRHFRMGPMLAKESVKQRLSSDEGMSFTEFSYQLLQGYDFFHLAEKYGARLQCGGSDQWGNITAGIDFGQKMGVKLHGLTIPLIKTADGRKLGKSEAGMTLWLSDFEKGPYLIYQYLLTIPDGDTFPLMKQLTEIPMATIGELEKSDLHPNALKERLAAQVVEDIFGQDGIQKAQMLTAILAPGSLKLPENDMQFRAVIAAAPHLCRTVSEEDIGKKLIDLLVELKIFTSKGEISRLAQNKGLFINGQAELDPTIPLTREHFLHKRYLLVGKGKKEKQLLVLS